MPHLCTRCKKTFQDGSIEFLQGCPICRGTTFQRVKVKWNGGQVLNHYIGAWENVTVIHRSVDMGILSSLFRPNIERLKKRKDVERLIRALQHRDWHIRMDAADALGALADERAIDPLIECLKDESRHVRREAAMALGLLGDKRAIEPLIQALRGEWDDSETSYIEAIERLGDKTSIQPLVKAFKYRSKWVRGEEDESLGKIQDVMRMEPVSTVLKDEEKVLKWESDLLQRIGDARDIEPIIEALNYETALSRWRESFRQDQLERSEAQGEKPSDGKKPEDITDEKALRYIKKKAIKK